jgi:spermidine synthase
MFMKKWAYYLSYFYPVTIELTSSNWNPVLEVVLYCGKFSLNSENTNYSHGTLHTLFEKTFRRLNLDWTRINSALILGFGTGSIATIIDKYKHECIIEGVEIDKKVLDLGEKYFHNDLLKNVTIYCTGADKYLENCRKKFDLIIIDVYLDMIVPAELEKEEFLMDVKNSLNPGGMVIFNKAVYSKAIIDQLPALRELYKRTFNNVEMITLMRSGKIFISRN